MKHYPASTWSVPRLWEGRTVAVLASGPSMSAEVALHASTVPSIAVNTTYQLAPWADMVFAADAAWWRHYRERARECCPSALLVGLAPANDVLTLRSTGRSGFDPDPTAVRDGGNSGYAAVHIAAHAGAKRILLLGFDMKASRRGTTHWHGQHPGTLRNAGVGIFVHWLARFATLAPELAARGIEVVNCTPDSALRCFPTSTLEDALESAVPVS